MNGNVDLHEINQFLIKVEMYCLLLIKLIIRCLLKILSD
jgi:hypothetical protein